MQINEAWLRELVNPPVDTDTLVHQLTMAGLEVDAITPVAAVFSGVVVGEVTSTAQHPNADKLKVCQVDIGATEPLKIVCGASNVRPGLKVPAALIGAVLPGDFKIQKSKLRGEDSFGMLCSEKELGLATASSGLMELPADAPVGTDIRDYLSLDDNIIELGLTPNRADCLSIEGIAREVAVLNKQEYVAPSVAEVSETHTETLAITVETPDACPVYLGRLIRDINPDAVTPLWMRERLRRCGIRSLSPIVDVTNYVLLELGQPLHAFDADTLTAPLCVRFGLPNETLQLLNDQTIELDAEAVVIADQQQPLALAGVMGGSKSAVTNQTRNIFLECAFFHPIKLAGKARKFGLHTDSSHRFERGVDFTLQKRAIERATQLIVDIAGGSVGPVSSVISEAHLPARNPVVLREHRIEKMLGIRINDDDVQTLFKGLGMSVARGNGEWHVSPPGFRFDITIEEDLLEEIARVYGYNNLPSKSLLMRSELGKASESQLTLSRLQDCLVDRGYQEAITYSFVDEATQTAIAPDEQFIRIQNPISSELAIMRTSLWSGLINAAIYNINRQQSRVRLFEAGLSFTRKSGEIRQRKMFAGLTLGNINTEQWAEKPRNVDFFDVKADVEALLSLSAHSFTFRAAQHPALHPGQCAEIVNDNGDVIGLLGMLHPNLETQFGFDSAVFLFELKQDAILSRAIPKFAPLSKFPSVRRDMALLVKQSVSVAEIIACIDDCREPAVRDAAIFDVYQGKGIEEGFKSIALSLVIQDFSQTLTDSEIDAIFFRLLEKLATKLDAKLRD